MYKYNIKKANWNLFTNNAKLEKQGSVIDENCDKLTMDIVDAAEITIPKNSAYIRGKVKVPWWNENCRNALTKRNRMYRQYKTQRTK